MKEIGSMARRPTRIGGAALVVILWAWGPAAAREAGLASKTFSIRYRTVGDVAAVIQPVLSENGSYAVQPRLRTLTVTDTPEALRRVEELIAGYDLPPRGVNLVVQLMRAEEGSPREAEGGRPPRRMGLPPAVIQDVTKWGVITQIGSASLATAENERGAVTLGAPPDQYRVRFSVGTLSPGIGVIRLERFLLEKVRAGPDGRPRFTPLMDLVLNLREGQTTVLGATSSQDSKQALFVSLIVTVLEP